MLRETGTERAVAERTMEWTARALGGDLLAPGAGPDDGAPGARRWNGVAIDSRRIEGGELFFAFHGEQADGHDFLADAGRRGAAGVVVHRDVDAGELGPLTPRPAVIRVEDTYEALHELTRAVRREVPEHLVAITGSAGKTTTKEILASVLAVRYRVARSQGNFNNLYGFPVSLLGIPDDTEWMVAEMGMSTPGELRGVSLLGRPDVAVFTNVRPAHLENFDSLRSIAEAKSEILAGLAEDGVVIANADDAEVMRVARRHVAEHPAARLLTYGILTPDADVRASDVEPRSDQDPEAVGSRFRLHFREDTGRGGAAEKVEEMELSLHGLYNVENALAAAACALHLGLAAEEIRRAFAALSPAAKRGEVHRLPSGLVLVDDSYNSNPVAAERALESVARIPSGGRRVAILGDMLELGPQEDAFHQEVGEAAARLGFDVVLAVGELSRDLAEGAAGTGIDVRHFHSAEACAHFLAERPELGLGPAARPLGAGDVVLAKASRGIGLEVAVEAILASEEEGESRDDGEAT